MDKISYKSSGVDIDAGNSFVDAIKSDVKSTFNRDVIGGIGSFAGAYSLPSGYRNPVLLSATDGVGTKLKIAIESGILNSVGIDLVAMCVNDLICNFGTPLFFLDYYATGKLNPENAQAVVKGIADGCLEAECALIGGETAEMPDMYGGSDFDLAGFAVGVAERDELDRVSKLRENQIVVAIPSSGIHSNGYSLVRKLFFEKLKMSLDSEFDGKPLVETLLKPTRIYVKDFKSSRDKIIALAHITGGGLVENIPRVLPDNLSVEIEKSKIRPLPIFDFIGKYVEEDEMYRTFNMGVGMVIIVDENNVDSIFETIDGSYIIGRVVKGKKGVSLI
ncbi:MAG: phosphoribosylformylglycinamidine cyclo-ligase [Epsilonproteobacteria bacterium]|nr:phosphoribosylformylglycinamidine cyclo-ligase [Campylobacterota bacterium]